MALRPCGIETIATHKENLNINLFRIFSFSRHQSVELGFEFCYKTWGFCSHPVKKGTNWSFTSVSSHFSAPALFIRRPHRGINWTVNMLKIQIHVLYTLREIRVLYTLRVVAQCFASNKLYKNSKIIFVIYTLYLITLWYKKGYFYIINKCTIILLVVNLSPFIKGL